MTKISETSIPQEPSCCKDARERYQMDVQESLVPSIQDAIWRLYGHKIPAVVLDAAIERVWLRGNCWDLGEVRP